MNFFRDVCARPACLRNARFLAMVFGVVGYAHGSIIYNFANNQANSTGNALGNSLTLTVSGITVTETGWSLANTNSTTKFAKAAVDNYNGTNLGLGVCSSNDPSGASCASPYHQIDNANTSGLPGGDEFILFQFSSPINLGSITVTNYSSIDGSTAVDLTYYSASSALTTNSTLASLGTGTSVNGNAGSGTPVTFSLSGSNVTYLIVGASVPDSGVSVDSFKLNAISVSATPEPGTLGTLALCLIVMGTVYFRRRVLRNAPAVSAVRVDE